VCVCVCGVGGKSTVCGSRGISLLAGGGMRIQYYKVTQPSRKDDENTEK
jgi:hypothetical protein